MKINRLIERITYNWPAKILSILAALTITYFYYRYSNVSEKYINVPLHLDINENLTTADEFKQTAKVIISGQSEDIFQIDEENIYVYADFSDYFNEGEYRATVKYYLQNAIPDDIDIQISIEPAMVDARLETKIKKSVNVKADVSGFPKTGYDLIELSSNPEIIEIIGPEKTLENIDSINTSVIDISGLDNDFSFRIPLVVPQGNIQIPEGNYVEVLGRIGPTMVVKTFDEIEIVLVQLTDGFSIRNALPKGVIKVRGNQNVMNEYDKNDFSLLVNCLEIDKEGKYTLPVKYVLPLGVELNSIEPDELTLEVYSVKEDAGTGNR